MSGLFSTFNVATRGMSAQQKALDVTSHNIANANTEGYSRQRATMETTRPFGMPSMNNAVGPGQLGTGVQISSITRIRDGFLDYQVRTENGTKGKYEGREKFLSQIEGVMNEPSDTGVSNLLGKVFSSWTQLSLHPESSNSRTVVAQQSKALTDELNNTYNQLNKLKGNSQEVIKQDVVDINSMLNQLNELNQQVISVKVGGNEPNDLMDRRDLLVDQLSLKFGITINKKALGGEDIKTDDDCGMANACLVSSNSGDIRRFSYVSSINKKADGSYDVTYYKNGDTSTNKNEVTINMTLDSDQYKKLDQGRVLWADKDGNAIKADGSIIGNSATFAELKLFTPIMGELNGYMSVQGDIDNYVDQLNGLAKGIAFSINAVHSGESNSTTTTHDFFLNKDTGIEAEITAGNISINPDIIKDPMTINTGIDNDSSKNAPGDGKRALAIESLKDVRLDIQSINKTTTRAEFLAITKNNKFSLDPVLGVNTITSSVNGMTVSGYFTDIVARLAGQTQEAKRFVTNHESLLAQLEESRTSISGVSLDEEIANMVQYQHAYQANAKIISTVDELLDVVINGLKK
ncbi:flagellar hook-associated protein FlgK [Clostridium estertheticum]|uniref:flagellar hook-associated protein FlgK n=1 Tax=Clostridium estertheticum TaxID=238834 RepID=UPI00124E96F7|nr:flagellar hook-associated protein FlgK [Clostridium estertheticum]MBU3170222.1 flagellar hook-associated protein FlgK [Clostridium estertheticum]MBZ9616998.1 flagellar hook-associated protein FlgK [Clostridium estertheticum subsp. laramiense]WAG72700.1 flagellar hook-associated protein FlgK [Clostridium estertheticum]